MAIEISNVPLYVKSTSSPARFTTDAYEGSDSHFDLNIKVTVPAELSGKDGIYNATVSISRDNYDISLLPAKSLALPVTLSWVGKGDFLSLNFTTSVPSYDEAESRRPILTTVRLSLDEDTVNNADTTLNLLNNYILIISFTDMD